jgi:hypothetical protein
MGASKSTAEADEYCSNGKRLTLLAPLAVPFREERRDDTALFRAEERLGDENREKDDMRSTLLPSET